MNNTQIKKLCLSLMQADTEEEVIALLRDVGYWDNPAVWRYYGDRESNYNTIGNQQSRPDAALVEKIVNSVDARLMNECLVRGISLEGSSAPQSVREAIACFFDEGTNPNSTFVGRIKHWPDSKRLQIAKGITLAATGATARSGNPCISIADCGEGQTPEMMPHTLLSLDRTNKLRIPFVQGKFNMGGTGVLQFCGRLNLQFILSRRNPSILSELAHPSDTQWGFTIVRREDPEGGRRSSIYTYLAPLGAEKAPRQGGVLRFSSDEMPIFPEGVKPYTRMSEWGTLIKLYEYSASGYSKSNILRKDGLLSRVDLLLPEVALPVRFHECRSSYGGHAGSYATSLTGLGVRLEDDKGENLESDFPSSCPMSAAGEQMTANIFAFKKGRAETYRKNEGIIFTLNGQTHGYLTPDFFRRKQVGLSYLADSILIIVDCSKFGGRAREDLFMNSRDRLRSGDLRAEIERALEDLLKHHPGLRALKERRRREEIESAIESAKPLEDILKSLIERYPNLAALFLPGDQATNPFKTIKVKSDEKPFEGKRYPTYFKFKDRDYGQELYRDCHINLRCRINFETDAVNDYFSRDVDPGDFSLYILVGNSRSFVENYNLNLQNGIATLSIQLPEMCHVGSVLRFVAVATDPSQIRPFENTFSVTVKKASESSDGDGTRRKSRTKGEGEESETSAGILLPKPVRVFETDWQNHNPPFDQYTALRIKHFGAADENGDGENGHDIYDFYINMDNLYLKRHLKYGSKSNQDERVTRTRFEIGLILVGLALIQQAAKDRKANTGRDSIELDEEKCENLEDHVERVSKAISPFLLPMIEALGTLDAEDSLMTDGSGEAT